MPKIKELQFANLRVVRAPIIGEVTEPHPALIEHPIAHAKQITFHKVDFTSILSDESFNCPDTDVAIFFVPGAGSKDACLHSKQFHFVINGRLYRRLTWMDVKLQTIGTNMQPYRRQNGMSVQRNGKLVYYVIEVPLTSVVRRAIAQAIGNEL